jgi:hypothetical protein
MKMSKADRVAIDDLERIIRLAVELRRTFPAAVEMADDVNMGGSVEGPSSRTGSHSDPTANAALDGRRKRRRSSVKKARQDISTSLRHLQGAIWHACTAADE